MSLTNSYLTTYTYALALRRASHTSALGRSCSLSLLLIITVDIIIIITVVIIINIVIYFMYQILQKFDVHWPGGGPSIAMIYHLKRISALLYDWKSCLLCYMKDVVLHCSIFFNWNKIVRVRVRVGGPNAWIEVDVSHWCNWTYLFDHI